MCIITGDEGGMKFLVMAINPKGRMVYGGQVPSRYCFANLNDLQKHEWEY